MLEIEAMPQMIEQRQAYLRSLAGHGPQELSPEPLRRRAGRALVRIGVWLEGRRLDEGVESLLTLPATQPRLTGGARRA